MSEQESALILADKILERPNVDPDGDLAVLSRQLLRGKEREDRLHARLDRVLIGVNHIALYKTARWPDPGTDHEMALRILHATQEYDLWCCWNAAMCDRDDTTQEVQS